MQPAVRIYSSHSLVQHNSLHFRQNFVIADGRFLDIHLFLDHRNQSFAAKPY